MTAHINVFHVTCLFSRYGSELMPSGSLRWSAEGVFDSTECNWQMLQGSDVDAGST